MTHDEGEGRRLSAVMFTDMVGYSSLAQKNEILAIELLEEHRIILRSLFNKFHGREIETVGDAFFIEFTNTLEAVHCAIAIQEKLYTRRQEYPKDRWIKVRIGIHAGDVIHKERQVLGDCVNIAARMEPMAEPGGICLSEDVARQIYNKIDLPIKALGRSDLKNIKLPIKIFKVVLPWENPPSLYQSSKLLNRKHLSTFIISFVVLFICVVGYLTYQFFRHPPNTSIRRLAVLPLDNLTPDANNQYISDGFHEEIISVLSKIDVLRVTGRTSVMQYRNKETKIIEVGEDLNVDLVLEGSVRKEINRIRLIVQLIDAKLDEHLWSQTYDKKYNNILDLQRDLAYEVARQLKIELKALEKKQIDKKSTKIIEAWELYSRGLSFWNSRLPQHLVTGLEYFQKAVDVDPTFARSYTGIANSYHLLASYGLDKPTNSFPKAKEAALQAIRLDEDLAEAANSLAAINLLYDWDWKEAERGFARALQLDPSCVQAYTWYALYLSSHKRFDEAKSKLHQAIELDPLSAMVQTDLAQVFYHEGNYEQAIKEYQKSLQLDSNYVYTYAYLGQSFAVYNMLDEAEEAFKYAVELTQKQDPATMAGLAYVYARQNKTELAMTIVKHLENLGSGFYVHPVYLAIVYEALNMREKAIYWLKRGFEERSEWMIFLQVEHMLDPMRGDLQFEELVRKMNFEEAVSSQKPAE